jgi:hypothetical protein
MRCDGARFPFDLTRTGALASMAGIEPEPVTAAS